MQRLKDGRFFLGREVLNPPLGLLWTWPRLGQGYSPVARAGSPG